MAKEERVEETKQTEPTYQVKTARGLIGETERQLLVGARRIVELNHQDLAQFKWKSRQWISA